MQQAYDDPDMDEFIAACAKQFCPWCGKAMTPVKKRGRPRAFCSDRCRWAFSKHKSRQREKDNAKRSGESPEPLHGRED